MNDQDRRARYERQLARQTVSHHLRREQELERLLADAMALAKTDKCKCRASRSLRQLADELDSI